MTLQQQPESSAKELATQQSTSPENDQAALPPWFNDVTKADLYQALFSASMLLVGFDRRQVRLDVDRADDEAASWVLNAIEHQNFAGGNRVIPPTLEHAKGRRETDE